jgi:hypothetical protein
LQIDLGAGNEIYTSGYRFALHSSVASGYFPLDWTLKGSNTGAFAGEEHTLDTQTNVNTGWVGNTMRSFPVTLPSSAATSITFVDINKKFLARDAWRKTWRTHVFTGTYTGGDPEFFDYQIHRASDGGVHQAWLPLSDITIGGGTWSGTAKIPQGGEWNVSIRADADADLIVNGTFDFAVGLVVLGLGQENMVSLLASGAGAPAPSALTYLWNGSWGSPSGLNCTRLLNEVVGASSVPCAIMHAAVNGAHINYALSAANGGSGEWESVIAPSLTSMGEAIEFVVWHQGENGGDYYEHPSYADKLNLIHQQVCAQVGRLAHEVTFLVASINSGSSGHTAEENIAHNLTQSALLNARHKYPFVLLSHSCYGCAIASGITYTAAEQQLNGARFGRTIAAVLGDVQGHPIFEIVAGRVIDDVTTDLMVRGGVATDFTGNSAGTNFTGFEVSGDNGTTWTSVTAGRLNATTIRVTHSALPTSNVRRVRYGYGWDAPVMNAVHDTSAYGSYLMPTPTRYGIAPDPLARTAVPAFMESRAGAGTVNDVPIGRWLLGKKVVVVAFIGGTAARTLTITPNAGGFPVAATAVTTADPAVQFWFAEVSGFATSVNLARSGSESGQYGIWWVDRHDLASLTPTSGSSSLALPANSVVLGAATGNVTASLAHARRYEGASKSFFDRTNASAGSSTYSGPSTILAVAFQANSVAVTQPAQAHNGGKWQNNIFPLWGGCEYPFANVLRSGNLRESDYSTVRPDHVDARGYALPGQTIRFADFFAPPQADLPGNYRLRWKGTGTLGLSATVISGSMSGTDGEAIVSLPDTGLGLYYTGDATNPISDISLVHVDYCASYDAGNPWNPKLLEVLAECRPGILRYLDWSLPNGIYAKWAHRKPLDYSVWSDLEPRGSEFVTTTNVGNAYTTSGSGGVLTHGQIALVMLSASMTLPTSTATLNWKGTGPKPLRNGGGQPFEYFHAELPGANTYHICAYDSVLDMWLMDHIYNWQSYPLPNGVPTELMLDLCNRVGAHPWIPIPYLATDPLTDYFPALGAQAREQLHPWLRLYHEPGNEWWNTFYVYICTLWGKTRENFVWGPPTGPYDHDGYRFYNRASANLGRVIAAIFGNDRRRFSMVSAAHGVASPGQTIAAANTENIGRYTARVWGENYHSDSGEYAKKWVVDVCCANYWGAAYLHTTHEPTYNAEYPTATPERKAEILNEFALGPLDPGGLYRQYSGLDPVENAGGALKWQKDRTYDSWGQIAADNGHGFVAYEGGCWASTVVAKDSKDHATAMRDLQRFDLQNWVDAGGTFPSQYWLSTPGWQLGLLVPNIYIDRSTSPAYQGVLDFNAGLDPEPPLGEAFTLTTEAGDALITESGDTLWTEGDIPVGPGAPVAAFTGSPLSGEVPLTVNFTNASTGPITSHAWTFGDGGTSTAASPSHAYTVAGAYTVTLIETGPGGSDTETRVGYVVASAGPPVEDAFTLTTEAGDTLTTEAGDTLWTEGDMPAPGPGEADAILTEAGDTLVTEAGDTLTTEGEGAPVPGDALLYIDLEARFNLESELEARFWLEADLEARFVLDVESEARFTLATDGQAQFVLVVESDAKFTGIQD